MKQLDKEELLTIEGGAISVFGGCALVAGVVFLIGVLDGYFRPLPCRGKES